MKTVLILCLLCAGPVVPEPPPATTTYVFQTYPVRNWVVVDGDTIRGDVDLPWEVTLRNVPIRLVGFDAWESRRGRPGVTVTDEEVIKGKAAKLALLTLLRAADRVTLQAVHQPRDNYGRLLGRLYVVDPSRGLIDVAEFMRKGGHQRTEPVKKSFELRPARSVIAGVQ